MPIQENLLKSFRPKFRFSSEFLEEFSAKISLTFFLPTERKFRAGHLGFAVLQWSSKIYFQAILIVKIIYLWARLIKPNYPKSIPLVENEKI